VADGLVGRPLGHPLGDQGLHQARGVEVAAIERGGDAGMVELRAGDQRRRHAEHRLERVDRVEDRLLVLLEVAVVGGGQPLQDHEQRLKVANRPATLAADEFQDIGVDLLGHDRTAGAEALREEHEAELRRAVDDPLLGPLREVHGREREHEGQFADEVAVARGVDAVGGDGVEAERGAHVLAVDRQAGAGQGAGAERQDVSPPPAVGQPLAVAVELLAPGEQLVGGEHRLRPAEVRVAGHDEPALPLREAEEGPLQLGQRGVDPVDRAAAVEPQVGGHLVVPAPRGVQFAAHVAEPGGEGGLDVEVDVLAGGRKLEPPGADVGADLLERLRDRVGLGNREQARGGEHPGVGDRAVDVVVGQPAVERHALREGLDPGVGRLAEHAAPGLLRS
jgi:hypothetical protein